MSEFINNATRRKEILKNVLRQLHEGKVVDDVKAEFGKLLDEVGAAEIAEIEQMLIMEGTSTDEIQDLCDVHVAVFQESLNQQPAPETLPGHPVFIFRAENRALENILNRIADVLHDAPQGASAADLVGLRGLVFNLQGFETHYLRKENLLFPMLEKKGFEGPSKVMWGIHDQIRLKIKHLSAALGNATPLEQVSTDFDDLKKVMEDMIYKEEHILFPTSLEKLNADEWASIRTQESDYGHFMINPVEEMPEAAQPVRKRYIPEGDALYQSGEMPLNTGALKLEQIDLLLNHLPVDVTFVDENDEVRYFSRGLERIFSRSTAIIGRKVQNCHPPQSMGRVQQIVDDFRSGKRNTAEFWIQMNGKFIHIRYIAMRDEYNAYKGTLEVSQDVTGIRALEGERRLLDE